MSRPTPARPSKSVLDFIQHEASGGIVLVIAAALAMVMANSALSGLYDAFVETPVTVRIGALAIDKPLLLWINDGLMAVFFFLVGLEIKAELMEGELSSLDRASLPFIAAVGGMVVPALVYIAFNASDPTALRGWAIPAATDIAFAVGVMALLGPAIPAALKIFLLALAIIDDLGAIIIIALFYTDKLSVTALLLASAGVAGLVALNLRGVSKITPYVLVGVFVWVCVLKSGVHATLAGVVLGFAIPLKTGGGSRYSPLEHLKHTLHPWVAFGVLPVFAFANAGVPLGDVSIERLLSPVPLGIALGLFVGKQVGILGASLLAIRAGLARQPDGVTIQHLYGAALLGGIGFTMSLFIGLLAFDDPARAADVRIGVLTGSILSAVAGYIVLAAAARAPRQNGSGPLANA